jgi:hypothetical protein
MHKTLHRVNKGDLSPILKTHIKYGIKRKLAGRRRCVLFLHNQCSAGAWQIQIRSTFSLRRGNGLRSGAFGKKSLFVCLFVCLFPLEKERSPNAVTRWPHVVTFPPEKLGNKFGEPLPFTVDLHVFKVQNCNEALWMQGHQFVTVYGGARYTHFQTPQHGTVFGTK